MTKRDPKDDPNEPTTLFQIARAGLDEAGGRWAEQDARVVGRDPAPYPAQPAGSPWAGDPVPPEAPTGESIDAMIPVGEVHEVAESLERIERERGSE